MMRIVTPGGWLVITTPNQISWLSKLSLLMKNQFVAFQAMPGLYPAHITALLPEDMVRIAREQDLTEVEILFSERGRMPLSSAHYPRFLSRIFSQGLSDNVFLFGRKGPARS
jgi:hypothetical protein